ncbi:MAG: hypothetical protein ACE1Y4_15630, partial [Lysobacterales bacterium]
SDADINALVVAVSGSGVFAGNGAISLNWIRKDIDAHISGDSTVTITQNIDILAQDLSDIRSIAGQISGSGLVAIGGAVSYNEIANNISAYIDGGNTNVTSTSGSITISATSEATIFTIAAGIAGSGIAAIAGSGSVNLIANDVVAHITGATVTAVDNLYLLAESDDTVKVFVGTISVAGVAGVGGSVVINSLTNQTRAYIDGDATVVAKGVGSSVIIKDWADDAEGTESTEPISGLAVVASAEEEVFVIAVAGGAAGAVGIGANVVVNRVNGTTEAFIRDSRINNSSNRGKAVKVKAHSDTNIFSLGGALGIGLSIGGFGAAVDTNFVDNITRAYIADDDSATDLDPIFAGDGVEVSALSREGFATTAIGIGAGLFQGVAGAASAIKSDSTTEAFIRNADVDAIMNIEVDADSAV